MDMAKKKEHKRKGGNAYNFKSIKIIRYHGSNNGLTHFTINILEMTIFVLPRQSFKIEA